MDSTKTGSNETTARAPAPKLEGVKTGKPRGFAAMDRSRVSEIARKGGIAAHQQGTAHEFTPQEAKLAASSR